MSNIYCLKCMKSIWQKTTNNEKSRGNVWTHFLTFRKMHLAEFDPMHGLRVRATAPKEDIEV